MSDNITLNSGSGGDTLAADEISGAKHQRVKIEFGGDGTATDVDASNPLPTQPNGDTPHDDPDSGNPLKIGAVAVNGEPSSVADGDRVQVTADQAGKLIVLPYASPASFLNGTASTTGTGDTEVIAAQSAGVRIYITSIQLANSSGDDVLVDIKDGTTILTTVPVPANGGATLSFPVPLRGSAATALNFASKTSASTVYCSVQGYRGA